MAHQDDLSLLKLDEEHANVRRLLHSPRPLLEDLGGYICARAGRQPAGLFASEVAQRNIFE